MTIMSPHFHSLKTDEPTALLRLAERRCLAVTRRAAGCSRAPLPCGSPVPGHRGGCPTRPPRPEAPPLPARPRRPRGGGARGPRRGRGCVTAPAPRAPRARSRASRTFAGARGVFAGITRVRGRRGVFEAAHGLPGSAFAALRGSHAKPAAPRSGLRACGPHTCPAMPL